MALVIKQINAPGKVDVKRFYVPGCVLEDSCPECGAAVRQDMSENYFSYPVLNTKFSHTFWCADCSCEWQQQLSLKITITAG